MTGESSSITGIIYAPTRIKWRRSNVLAVQKQLAANDRALFRQPDRTFEFGCRHARSRNRQKTRKTERTPSKAKKRLLVDLSNDAEKTKETPAIATTLVIDQEGGPTKKTSISTEFDDSLNDSARFRSTAKKNSTTIYIRRDIRVPASPCRRETHGFARIDAKTRTKEPRHRVHTQRRLVLQGNPPERRS